MASEHRRGIMKKKLGLDGGSSSSTQPGGSSQHSRNLRKRVLDIPTVPKPDRPFNKCMRRHWSRGDLASNKVLEYCNAVAPQGADHVIQVSAKWSAKNAHRDLVSVLGWPAKAPEVKWIMIPLGPKKEMRPHPIICPVDVWAKLAAEYPDTWRSRFQGKPGLCGRFWKSSDTHPIVAKHLCF